MNGSSYLVPKNLRKQEYDEILIDVDDRTEHGARCISAVGLLLYNAGYNFSLWYSLRMKQPHILVPQIFNLKEMPRAQVRAYKKAFLKKYIPSEFWQQATIKDVKGEIPDFSLCDYYEDKFHPVPIGGKPHHKYKTLYLKVAEFNKHQIYNFTEPDLFNYAITSDAAPTVQNKSAQTVHAALFNKSKGTANFLYERIASKISILSIADAYGLMPLGKKMRVCPFHNDSSPSLSLNDEKGLFKCFASGCQGHGNIIKFYFMLKQLNPNFKFTNNG